MKNLGKWIRNLISPIFYKNQLVIAKVDTPEFYKGAVLQVKYVKRLRLCACHSKKTTLLSFDLNKMGVSRIRIIHCLGCNRLSSHALDHIFFNSDLFIEYSEENYFKYNKVETPEDLSCIYKDIDTREIVRTYQYSGS